MFGTQISGLFSSYVREDSFQLIEWGSEPEALATPGGDFK